MNLLRVKAAADRYKISIFSFYKWHETEKFPGLFAKIGKILFVDETELKRIARKSKSDDVSTRRIRSGSTLLTQGEST